MLLVLNGAGTDCNVGKNIGNIPPVFGIEHFVCSGQSGFFYGTDVHLTHGNQSGEKVRFLFRVRLMDNALVALAGSSGLVGVNSGNQNQLVLYLFVYSGKPVDIIAYGIFVVRGAGSDNNQKFIALSGKDIPDFSIPFFLDFNESGRKRVLFPDFCRGGQFLYKFKTHIIISISARVFCASH